MEALAAEAGVAVVEAVVEGAAVEAVVAVEPTSCSSNPALSPLS